MTATVTKPKKTLAGLSGLATAKVTKPAKDKRATWTFDDKSYRNDLHAFLRISTIASEMDEIKKARESSIKGVMLDRWVKELWSTGQIPTNPRINITLPDSNIVDAECLFEVQKNSRALDEYTKQELGEDETIEDLLLAALQSPLVGLTPEKAVQFVSPDSGEVNIIDSYELVDTLENLTASDNSNMRGAGEKLIAWLQGGKDAITEAETAALLQVSKKIVVKDGFFDRAKTYCTSEDQLGKLIRFMRPRLAIKHVKFCESNKAERNSRLAETLKEFLPGD